jgi:phospholipid transport system substrate-binding protein
MLKRMLLTVTLMGFLSVGNIAAASDARDQLKISIDRLIALLSDDNLKAPEKKLERREKIFDVVRSRFDFVEMGKRSLSRHWKDLSQEDKDKFVDAFSKLIQNSYILKIERYGDEQVIFKGERTKTKYYYVFTELVSGQKKIPMNYSMHAVGDSWLVYDVSIEGVSLIKNYRTQFARTMKKEKFAGLMSKINAQVKKLESRLQEEEGA